MIRSLRSRLLVGVLAAVTCLLALFGVGVYESFRRALMAEFDQSLVSTARTLAAQRTRTQLELALESLPQFNSEEELAYFQAWAANGDITRSRTLGTGDLPRIAPSGDNPLFQDIILPSGQAGRAVAVFSSFQAGSARAAAAARKKPSAKAVLVMAQDTSEVKDRLAVLAVLLWAGGAATLAAAMAVMLIVVRRGLAPLNTIAHEISGITSDDLGYRVSAADMPAEMKPVASKLNDLLARLEEAFKRERGFASDVAHELRTPLAGIRSTLEVTLSRTRSSDDYVQAMEDCMAIAAQMQALVESLLMLARLSSGNVVLQRQELDLAAMVKGCWKLLPAAGGSDSPAFENRLGDLHCTADADCMRMVLANLLDNAVTYNCPGGRVWVDGLTENGAVHISVSNTGCTLPAEAAEQVFAPFWRGDKSRTMTGMHAGLGLSLVQRSIESQGGAVKAIINKDDGIFTIRMTLPAAKSRS